MATYEQAKEAQSALVNNDAAYMVGISKTSIGGVDDFSVKVNVRNEEDAAKVPTEIGDVKVSVHVIGKIDKR